MKSKKMGDLHFVQKCEWNLYKDLAECMFCFIRGKDYDLEKLKLHYGILNYLLMNELIDSNHYDNLNEMLDTIIQFFKT